MKFLVDSRIYAYKPTHITNDDIDVDAPDSVIYIICHSATHVSSHAEYVNVKLLLDIDPHFNNLKYLHITRYYAKDNLDFIKHSTNIEYLSIWVYMKSIEHVQKFKSLKLLTVKNVARSDQLRYLNNCTNLQYVDIGISGKSQSLEVFSNMPNLRCIKIDTTSKVKSLKPLINCKKLSVINMRVDDDFWVLGQLHNLDHVLITYASVNDIEKIKHYLRGMYINVHYDTIEAVSEKYMKYVI
jgi:hypothetical protein